MSDPKPAPESPANHDQHGHAPHLAPSLITNDEELKDFLATAAKASVIGVDTESNSLYAYFHEICLIQISLPWADYIIDPLTVDVTPLGPIFANPNCQKIFHAAENDILGLKRDFGFEFANLFDTLLGARILGWPRVGLASILSDRFGVTLDKRLQRTNWGQRPLKPEQLAYARLDTHYLLPLREQQIEALRGMGRWQEAQESFQRLTSLEWSEKPFDPDGYWRISGARGLTPRGRAVLRSLFLFREEQARIHNLPPFKVLDKRALITISQRQPRSLRALRRLQGIGRYQVRTYGKGVLAAVERGRIGALPDPPHRKSPINRPDRPTTVRYEALRAWRKERAQRRGVDPDVVLTNEQLMLIARQPPASVEALTASQVLGPWKAKEYGGEILAVLDRVG
jgi:ribonuclease D